jgi:hypothetical protein
MRTYREIVCDGPPNGNLALCDHGNSVHVDSPILEHTVPVNRRCLVSEAIIHIGNNAITFGEVENGQRPLVVDTYDRSPRRAIGVRQHPSDIPVIHMSFSRDKLSKNAQQQAAP